VLLAGLDGALSIEGAVVAGGDKLQGNVEPPKKAGDGVGAFVVETVDGGDRAAGIRKELDNSRECAYVSVLVARIEGLEMDEPTESCDKNVLHGTRGRRQAPGSIRLSAMDVNQPCDERGGIFTR
jgi:hypothetical protein